MATKGDHQGADVGKASSVCNDLQCVAYLYHSASTYSSFLWKQTQGNCCPTWFGKQGESQGHYQQQQTRALCNALTHLLNINVTTKPLFCILRKAKGSFLRYFLCLFPSMHQELGAIHQVSFLFLSDGSSREVFIWQKFECAPNFSSFIRQSKIWKVLSFFFFLSFRWRGRKTDDRK